MMITKRPLMAGIYLLTLAVVSACSSSDNNPVSQTPANDQPLLGTDSPITQTPGSQTPAAPVIPVDNSAGNPAGSPTGGVEPPVSVDSPQIPDVTTPVANSPVQISDGQELAVPSASGSDETENDDDSPTPTESASLAGPFIKDASRGAGPPSVPQGLTLLLASENWLEFSWQPSTDDQSVEAYEIYRDGSLIATVRGDTGYEHDYRSWISTSYIDCNYTRYADCADRQPVEGASYSYSVVAVDNEGMKSAQSEPAVFTLAQRSSSAVDLSSYVKVFSEEFDGTSLDRSRWKTALPWGPDTTINRETQYFVNTFGENPPAYDPFVFTGDTLQITGIETPANLLAAANDKPYLSGVITTSDYFEMTYGYVETRARVAGGDGLLSTFYLFNQDFYKNKPEIDVLEYIGSRPDKAYQTYHYYDSNRSRDPRGEKHSSPTMETNAGIDLSADFHTYGVLWAPELVVWYINGQEVRRLTGPRVSDEPMNIIAQLVIGSEWIGAPAASAIPAVYEIDYIRAWQQQ